jgi:neutral ceramidase
MNAGHGVAALPVPAGAPMGGYADRRGGASGVLDGLQVHCVSISAPNGRFLLVVADILCVNEDLAAAVRHRVTGTAGRSCDVWVCASHTHSGPDVRYVPGGGQTPARWRHSIAAAAAEAAREAVTSELPCSGHFHSGALREVGSVRGEEGAVPEVTVDVVSCVDADGLVRGVLAVVPVHPTVLPAASTVVSGDLMAAIRRSLRRRFEPDGSPWVVVAIGAAGDISTRRTRRAGTPAECERLGDEAARQIAPLIESPPMTIWAADGGTCAAARHTAVMPARQRDLRGLEELRRTLEEEYAGELRAGTTAAARTLETALQGVAVAQADEARRGSGSVPVSLSAARLGRLALFGVGGEPFHSYSDDLRSRCADPSVLLGCTNGHMGYLPDEPAYGTTGYEVLSSPLGPDAPTATVASLIELLPDPTEDS